MPDLYSLLKLEFRNIIANNLANDFELNRRDLKPYRTKIFQNRNLLRFYRYTPSDYYSIRNIETDTLALVNPIKFNDVFEGIPQFYDDGDLKKSDIIRDSAMITCFCEEENNLLMFAHYAQSYTGMCVEYDFSLLDDTSVFLNYLFPVLYEEKPSCLKGINELARKIEEHYSSLSEGKVSLHKLTDIISYFVHKPAIWNYEREWRIIVPTDQYNNVFSSKEWKSVQLINNFDCITKIFLGIRIDNLKREHILEIVEKKNIKRPVGAKIEVYETNLSGDRYMLNTSKVN